MLGFTKYHGLGNDFIVIDGFEQNLPDSILLGHSLLISRISQRNFGIGADGIILSLPPEGDGDVRMKIYNSDGTEAEMCGNGVRCLVKFLFDNNIIPQDKKLKIETLAGIIIAKINKDNYVSVDMGSPIFKPDNIPTTLPTNQLGLAQGNVKLESKDISIIAIGMGNPHMIVLVNDLMKVPLERWGRILENNSNFPSKTNVHFVEVKSRKELKVLVWERGCGPTLACGTGACACAVATNAIGLTDNDVTVILPGGKLGIQFNSFGSNIIMTGPAVRSYQGQFDHLIYM